MGVTAWGQLFSKYTYITWDFIRSARSWPQTYGISTSGKGTQQPYKSPPTSWRSCSSWWTSQEKPHQSERHAGTAEAVNTVHGLRSPKRSYCRDRKLTKGGRRKTAVAALGPRRATAFAGLFQNSTTPSSCSWDRHELLFSWRLSPHFVWGETWRWTRVCSPGRRALTAGQGAGGRMPGEEEGSGRLQRGSGPTPLHRAPRAVGL